MYANELSLHYRFMHMSIHTDFMSSSVGEASSKHKTPCQVTSIGILSRLFLMLTCQGCVKGSNVISEYAPTARMHTVFEGEKNSVWAYFEKPPTDSPTSHVPVGECRPIEN